MRRRALIIATETYDDPRFSRLPGTMTDAAELDAVLSRPDIGAFAVTAVRNGSGRAVAIQVEEFFKNAAADETLLLYISGHGETDEDGHLYFINSDTDGDLLNATALSAHDVNKEMRHSPARAIIVLLDCCYGGAFVRRGRSRGKTADIEALQGRGRVVMTAATAVQSSYERASGQFTDAVVEGLRSGDADANDDGLIDTKELFDYVCGRVQDRRQTPTYFADIVYGPLFVGKNVRQPEVTFPELRRRPILALSRPRKFVRDRWDDLVSHGPMSRRLLGGLLAGTGLLAGCGIQSDSLAATGACPTTSQLRIAADPADEAAYGAVADDFERFVAEQAHGCRSVRVHLFPAEADEVTALIRDRPAGGPHPDVWLPGASRDVPAGLSGRVEQVARTPIVLGVPTAQVAADDEELRTAKMSWPLLFALADGAAGSPVPGGRTARGWGVIRGDPTLSTTAQLVTDKLYADKSPSGARTDVERWIEQRLDAGRYPLGDESSLLCRQLEIHRASPPPKTPAVILTEQDLVRFNLGYPVGSCVPPEPPGDADHLVAFYPSQTPVVSKVAVQLRWPRGVQSAQTQAYAQWFVKWLLSKPGRAALGRQGLRTVSMDSQATLTRPNGAHPQWPFGTLTSRETTVDVARETAALYAKARRPGRFLIALDTSGSMNAATDDPTLTRHEVAVAALRQAVTHIGARDELGLVTFSGPGATPPRRVLDFTRPTAGLAARVERLASAVRPGGDTPLYEAVRRGAALLREKPAGGDQLRALVVLTDGRDTSRGSLPTAAETDGVRVFVIAVGNVTCDESALQKITSDSGGVCYDAGLDALEGVLSGMFRAVWDS
jgi:Mg-chelatase subunit ChlD